MITKQFYIKHSKKSIHAVIYHADRRITKKWVIPKNKSFEFDGKRFHVTDDGYYMVKGKPVYTYAEENPAPFNPFNLRDAHANPENMPFNSTEYQALFKANVMEGLFKSFNKRTSTETIMIIGFAVLFLTLIASIYYFNELYGMMQAEISRLQDMIRAAGGAINGQ